MELTQMNVCIDADLKAAGDRVLCQMGLTPSDIVRGVWLYAASHDETPAVVRDAISEGIGEPERIEAEMRRSLIERDANLIADFCKQHAPDGGITVVLEHLDYKAMREEGHWESLADGERP
jgi:antitoxin component of RelBE/YafQ-DinJ toxin-antitoxin module